MPSSETLSTFQTNRKVKFVRYSETNTACPKEMYKNFQ